MIDSAEVLAEDTIEAVLAFEVIREEAESRNSETVTYLLNVMDEAGLIRSVNEREGEVSVTFADTVDSEDLVIGPVGTPAADEALLLRSEI